MGTLVRDSRQLTPLRMRMRDASLLFFTFSAVSGHSFGWGWNSGSAYAFLQQNGLQTQLPRWRFLNLPFPNNPPNPGWLNAWEEVGQVVGEAPPQRLMINWANKQLPVWTKANMRRGTDATLILPKKDQGG